MTEEHPGAERRTDDARRAALMFATLGFAAEQTGRYARTVPCVFQKHEVLRLAQLDLDGRRLGGRRLASGARRARMI